MAIEPNTHLGRRICSYDVKEVSTKYFELQDAHGSLFFCGARCLAIWSLQLGTDARPSKREGLQNLLLIIPDAQQCFFDHLDDLVQWSVSRALLEMKQ